MAEEEAGTVTGEEAESAQPEDETQASTEETEASTELADGGEEAEEEEAEEPSRAQERIRELANAKKELTDKLSAQERQIRELAEKFEKTQVQTPRTIDEKALSDYLSEAEYEIESLKAEGKMLDAALKQRQLNKLLDEVEDHRKKADEWKRNATVQEQQARQSQEALKELDSAADFFRDHKKIPADVWDKGAEQWAEARRADPLLDRQYAEVWMRQGPVAAISFAYEHIQKAQSSEAERLKKEKEKKDAGKSGVPGAGKAGGKSIASWDQLMGLGSKVVQEYKKNNPKHYQELLEKHLK